MRKLALAALLASAVVGLTAASRPPVEQLVEGALPKCGNDVCLGSNTSRVRILGGITLEGSSAHADGGLTLTNSGKGTLVYDFPSVPATGAGSGCQDSASGTAAGCRFGDTVMLGIDQVPPANLNGQVPVAYISAANAFKVRVCNDSTDAGAVDYPDASYTVRCFR